MWRWLAPYFAAVSGNVEYPVHHRMSDSKRIRMECAKLSGTLYYNHKRFFSMDLLAISDASYCFNLFDLGQYGSNDDSGVLANLQMGQMLEDDLLLAACNT